MEYSNNTGAIVLSTGNKSELSVGYCTLYGDTNGGLNLIGDLYKMQVYALSRYYNELHGMELIPETIIVKEPSAELSPGQVDTDHFHHTLYLTPFYVCILSMTVWMRQNVLKNVFC